MSHLPQIKASFEHICITFVIISCALFAKELSVNNLPKKHSFFGRSLKTSKIASFDSLILGRGSGFSIPDGLFQAGSPFASFVRV